MIQEKSQDSKTKTLTNFKKIIQNPNPSQNNHQIFNAIKNIDNVNCHPNMINNNFNDIGIKNMIQQSYLQKIKIQESNYSLKSQSNRLQIQNRSIGKKNNQNQKQYQNFSEEDSDCCYSDQEEIFQNIDLNKRQILLHIEQIITKPTTDNITSDSQPNIIDPNFNENDNRNQFSQRKQIEQYYQHNIPIELKNQKFIGKLTPIKSLKKIILKKLLYSEGARNCAKLSLSLFKLYPNQNSNITYPLENEENLKFILQEWLKARKDIYIKVEHNGTLKKKTQKIVSPAEFQVEFDSDGELFYENEDEEETQNQNPEIIEIKQILKVNYTERQKYKGKDQVRCQFCHKSNKDISTIKKCGPFYGPFQMKKNKYFVHFLCAIWCYKVYLNDDDRLLGIQKSIQMASKKRCVYCQKNGAGLVCESCQKSMHYDCVINKCKFNWISYKLKCNECLDKQQNEQNDQEKNEQEQFGRQSELEIVKNFQIPVKMQIEKEIKLEKNVEEQKKQAKNMLIETNQQLKLNQNPIKQLQNSNTISLNKVKLEAQQKNQLEIDPNSRFDIYSESVQIIQSKYKPPKNKSKIIVKTEANIYEKSDSKKNKAKPKKSNK